MLALHWLEIVITLTLLASTDTLHNDKDFGIGNLEAPLSKILQGHESGFVVQWLPAKLNSLCIVQ
jgi:hypothetical protein